MTTIVRNFRYEWVCTRCKQKNDIRLKSSPRILKCANCGYVLHRKRGYWSGEGFDDEGITFGSEEISD